MAIVDAEMQALFMNPAAFSQVKDDKKSKGIKRSGKTEFSRMFDEIRGKADGALDALENLPVSEETLNILMDEVCSAGDTLRDRPLPDEIKKYKQAVRNFMNYVVKNCYSVEHEDGIRNFLKPGFKGPRGTPKSQAYNKYYKIEVIDKKLEDMAAMLMTRQMPQLEIVSRLEEIKGLLVDLLQ